MLIGNVADSSPTKVFKTAASIAGGAFTAVQLGENGVSAANASISPVGILAAETEAPIAAGDDVNVVISGGCRWTAAESLKAGDMLASDDNGKAIKATSNKIIFAQALSAAIPDEAAEVLIIRGGKA